MRQAYVALMLLSSIADVACRQTLRRMLNGTLHIDNQGEQILMNAVDIMAYMEATSSRIAALDATISQQALLLEAMAEVVNVYKPSWISDDGIAQVARLTAGDAATGDRFGRSVAIANGIIAVGADGGAGKAYLSRVSIDGDGTRTFTPPAIFQPSAAVGNASFGKAVALSPDATTVVVGAPTAKTVSDDSRSHIL